MVRLLLLPSMLMGDLDLRGMRVLVMLYCTVQN